MWEIPKPRVQIVFTKYLFVCPLVWAVGGGASVVKEIQIRVPPWLYNTHTAVDCVSHTHSLGILYINVLEFVPSYTSDANTKRELLNATHYPALKPSTVIRSACGFHVLIHIRQRQLNSSSNARNHEVADKTYPRDTTTRWRTLKSKDKLSDQDEQQLYETTKTPVNWADMFTSKHLGLITTCRRLI